MQKFTDAGYSVYIVGGPVRDLLLTRVVKDWDFTTDASPEEIIKLFPNGHYNNKFGTVGVPDGDHIFEITTMRKEGVYDDNRHPTEVQWTKDITEDLARRDFTMNALAMDQDQKLVDPFQGQEDLRNKIIRTVNNPDQRFEEDGLRLMRAVRFAAQLGFEIEENTWSSIMKNASLLNNISGERIREELLKIVIAEYADQGIFKLQESGILAIILPELDKNFGVKQEGDNHDNKYEIGSHSIKTMKFTPSNDSIVKFAALLHDIGKADTYKKDTAGNVTFYQHDIVGAKIAKEICQRLRFSKKDADRITNLVRYHLFTVDENQTDSALRRFIRNVGVENLEDMFALREGDRLGGVSSKTSWRLEEYKKRIEQLLQKPFSITDLKVNGQDVMKELKIEPSRKVGEVLQQLFNEVEEDHTKNERSYLLKRIQEFS